MADIVVSLPTDLAGPFLIGLLVIALIYAGIKIRRLPSEVTTGIATGLARFAKVNAKDENYTAAFAQLQECIFEAWDTKDPVALLPLVANPIAIKAWQNIAPSFRKLQGNAEKTEEIEYA